MCPVKEHRFKVGLECTLEKKNRVSRAKIRLEERIRTLKGGASRGKVSPGKS